MQSLVRDCVEAWTQIQDRQDIQTSIMSQVMHNLAKCHFSAVGGLKPN